MIRNRICFRVQLLGSKTEHVQEPLTPAGFSVFCEPISSLIHERAQNAQKLAADKIIIIIIIDNEGIEPGL